MRLCIENEILKVEMESLGAELKSIIRKDNQQEYMWEANPEFWGKTSPILFPFIGKMADSKYQYKGKSYEMEKHGFAKQMDFTVAMQEEDKIVLTIESNETTLENYPFAFLLEVEYRLEGDSLVEEWRVHNQGQETMYFAMGGHPAFACPLIKDGQRQGKRTDCFVKLYGVDGKDVLQSSEIGIPIGLTTGETFPVKVQDGVFPVVDHIFDKDALVFEKQGVTGVGFLDREGKEYARLEAPTCPVWGIWSMPPSEAPFLCIEPWWGICGSVDESGDLENRPYINHAEPGKVWQDGLRIRVFREA